MKNKLRIILFSFSSFNKCLGYELCGQIFARQNLPLTFTVTVMALTAPPLELHRRHQLFVQQGFHESLAESSQNKRNCAGNSQVSAIPKTLHYPSKHKHGPTG